MNINSEIVASYWWSFPKTLRERLCYQAGIDYAYSARRWMEISEDARLRLAPRVQLDIDAYEGFDLKER